MLPVPHPALLSRSLTIAPACLPARPPALPALCCAVLQTVVDAPNSKKSDLRRARSALCNLAPTSTGSATAIALIFPELKGKLNGLAIRVPLLNASITDCVFEVKRSTTAEEVNALLKVGKGGLVAGWLDRGAAECSTTRCIMLLTCSDVQAAPSLPLPACCPCLPLPACLVQEAAGSYLSGILGYEEQPLVSTDYINDLRSSIVDALSTQVIDGTMVKIYAW